MASNKPTPSQVQRWSSVSSRVELLHMPSVDGSICSTESNNPPFQIEIPTEITESSEQQKAASTAAPTLEAWLHLKRKEKKNTISNDQAVMSLIKALCGTGIFALPQAFRNAGLWAGIVLLLLNNTIAIFCLQILSRRAQKFCLQTKQVSLDYGKVVELTFANGPKSLTRFAKASRIIVNVLIGLCQFGICAAYFAFIAANLQQGFDFISDWSVNIYMAIVLPLLLLAGSLRYLKYLTILSTAANLIYIVVLSVTLYFIFQVQPDSSNLPAFQSWDTLPLAFGTIMFSFEAITVVLPVENRMKTPVDFTTWNGVLNTSCIVMCIRDRLCRTVKILIAIAVAFSYPLQFYVPMDLIATFIKEKFRDKQVKRMLLEYAARYGFILLTFLFAEVVSSLSLIISLVGSLTGASLALIIPPILDMINLYTNPVSKKHFIFMMIVNTVIALYGFIGLVAGTTISVMDISINQSINFIAQFLFFIFPFCNTLLNRKRIMATECHHSHRQEKKRTWFRHRCQHCLFVVTDLSQLVHCWQTCMAIEPEPHGNDCWQCVDQFPEVSSPGGHFPQSLDTVPDPAPPMRANQAPLGAPVPDRRQLRPWNRTTSSSEKDSEWKIARHRIHHVTYVEAFDPLGSAFASVDHIGEINPSDNLFTEAYRLLRHAARRITTADASQRRAAAAVHIQRITGIAFRITSFSSILQYTCEEK
ncbi:Proton-coupled amino acid transporter 4 [Trichinella zimbabwensis]|uniref:Proton-coupled amino acid transporter 4 n=1 Tax=Trichinella zimbabwensis TaxID=268475 RepID=A0A0V1H6S9_9BILA|nr:Proton-coupled amino acid transporter 4 [Trichinella zimbabwensis]